MLIYLTTKLQIYQDTIQKISNEVSIFWPIPTYLTLCLDDIQFHHIKTFITCFVTSQFVYLYLLLLLIQTYSCKNQKHIPYMSKDFILLFFWVSSEVKCCLNTSCKQRNTSLSPFIQWILKVFLQGEITDIVLLATKHTIFHYWMLHIITIRTTENVICTCRQNSASSVKWTSFTLNT